MRAKASKPSNLNRLMSNVERSKVRGRRTSRGTNLMWELLLYSRQTKTTEIERPGAALTIREENYRSLVKRRFKEISREVENERISVTSNFRLGTMRR